MALEPDKLGDVIEEIRQSVVSIAAEQKKSRERLNDPDKKKLPTTVAILAVIVTGGQLWVAYLSYQSSTAKNQNDQDIANKNYAATVLKNNADAKKNQDDSTREAAKLILEHSKELFETRDRRDLAQKIALSLDVPFKDQLIAEVLKTSNEKGELDQRQAQLAAQSALPRRVYIHYRRVEDELRVNSAVGALSAQGFVVQASRDNVGVNSTATQFMYFKNEDHNNADQARRLVAQALGIQESALRLT